MTEFARFSARITPGKTEDLPRFLDDTFIEIQNVLEVVRDGHLDVVYTAPDKPRQGDIRYADGTSWDPGSGEGIYFYNSAGSWVKL